MSVIGEARAAIARLREWPRCRRHDRPLAICSVQLVGRLSLPGSRDQVELRCEVDGCQRMETQWFDVSEQLRKVVALGSRFENPEFRIVGAEPPDDGEGVCP